MTTHTMRIPVTAWRVADDGSLPEDMPWMLRFHLPHGHDGPHYNPGDWVVKSSSPFPLVIMSDAQFRACCEEVER